MNVSSLSALSLAASVTAPAAANISVAPDATPAIPFAQILSRGKTADNDHDSTKPTAEKTDTDSQDKSDSATDASAADPTTVAAATPDDLNAAANQGVSAVLALLGSIQAPPTPLPPQPSGTEVVADVASTDATTSAHLFTTAAPPALPATAGSAPAQAATDPAPLELPTLSPAELQLLRGLKSGSATDAKTAAADGTSKDATASAPNISSMAMALHQAFGQPQPGSPPAPVAQAAPAPPPSADVTAKPATKDAHASKDDASPDIAVAASDATVFASVLATSDTKVSAPTTIAAATPGIAPPQSEQSVTRHLDMLRDTQWLDRLAQDIKQAGAQNGHLKFQLNPEHLGSLAVEITNGAGGASIRMTTDNDNARAIIADAQPRLLAEVRAQGLRVAESHVDMGNQANSGNSAGHRPSSEDHKPFVRTQIPASEESSDSAPRDDELYA